MVVGAGSPGNGRGHKSSCSESPPSGSGGQRDPLNLAGNPVKMQQAREGAFLINPQVGRSSDHTLSRQVLENILRSHVSPNPNHFAQFHSRSQDMYVGFMKCSFHLCNFFIGILKLTLGSRVTGLKGRENK